MEPGIFEGVSEEREKKERAMPSNVGCNKMARPAKLEQS